MTTTRTRSKAPSVPQALEAMAVAAAKHMASGPLAPPRTHRLAFYTHVGEILYDLMCQEIVTLRRDGASWLEIGDALDVTRQAAYERFHHVDPIEPDGSGRRNTGGRRIP